MTLFLQQNNGHLTSFLSLGSLLASLAGLCAVGSVGAKRLMKTVKGSVAISYFSEKAAGFLSKFAKTTKRGKALAYPLYVLAFVTIAVILTAGVMRLMDRTVEARFWYLPHVPQLMPDNEYVVLHLDRNDPLYGEQSLYKFCPESKPIPFNEGQLITWIKYRQKADCKEIVNFNLDRDGIQATDHKEAP